MSRSSRREFIATSSTLFGGAWLAANFPMLEAVAARARSAHENEEPFEVLTPAQVKTMSAFAEQILPSDELPGAREAGAIYFIDKALAGPMKDLTTPIQALSKFLDDKAKLTNPAVTSFADLTSEQQIAVMKDSERSNSFFVGRMLTLMGTFSHPKWGGGRADVGFKLLHIDHKPVYQPPFGYYDAEEMRALKARH